MGRIGRRWRRALPAIAFFCLAVTLAMAVYTDRYEPERYRASYILYALPAGSSDEAGAGELAQMLCRDCDLLVCTSEFQKDVLASAESDGRTRVYVRQADGAHMLRVEAIGVNARVAAELANGAGRRLLRALEDMGAQSVHPVEEAAVPQKPFAPNRPKKVAAAFGASFALFSLIGVLCQPWEEPVCWNARELPELAVPCLAGVAEYDACLRRQAKGKGRRGKKEKFASLYDAADALTKENLREACLRLRSLLGRRGYSLVVTGMEEEETASLSLLLASEMAAQGFEVLLMEMDSYRPRLRELLRIRGNMDVADCLLREEALRTALMSTPAPRLCFMDVCHEPGFLNRIAATEQFAAFLSDASQSFDCVILNAPPCRAVSDAELLGAAADGTVLAVQDGKYGRKELNAVVQELSGRVRQVSGVLFCRVPLKRFSRKGKKLRAMQG